MAPTYEELLDIIESLCGRRTAHWPSQTESEWRGYIYCIGCGDQWPCSVEQAHRILEEAGR